MIIISHMLASVIVLRILPLPFNSTTRILSVVFGLLPDVDIFFSQTIADHHDSPFHAPLFWFVVSLMSTFLFPVWLVILLLTQVMTHLFLDFITARTTGVPILYPFVRKEYSLYPLDKEKGNVHPFAIHSSEFRKLMYFYLQNLGLVMIEGVVIVFGLFALI